MQLSGVYILFFVMGLIGIVGTIVSILTGAAIVKDGGLIQRLRIIRYADNPGLFLFTCCCYSLLGVFAMSKALTPSFANCSRGVQFGQSSLCDWIGDGKNSAVSVVIIAFFLVAFLQLLKTLYLHDSQTRKTEERKIAKDIFALEYVSRAASLV